MKNGSMLGDQLFYQFSPGNYYLIMKEETNKQIFRREIAKWYRLNKINRGYNSQYLSILHETIQKHCKVPISFDSRYADAIRFCISESLFTVFCEQEQTALLQIYRNMSRKLYQRGLISKRHCFDIDRIKPFNITCKINQFLIRMQIGKPSPAEAQQQWLELLQVPLAHFWQLVLQKQIKQEILVILYGIIQKSPSIVKNQQLRTYMLALKMHDEEIFAQEQIYKVEEDFQREVERGLQIEVEECLGRELETNKARNRKVSCSNTQTRQESHPAQRRVYRTHQIANADKDAQSLLKSIAFQNSMFRNPKYRQIIQKINEFVIYFASTIRKGEYKLEKFGSLRSNFALSNQYDIDLTFVSPKPRQNQRYIGATCLGQIEKEIISKSFAWYKTSVVYSFPKLPVPYMKMQIDAKQFQQTFSIQNTTKIDITVGNRSAIINSDILFHYASVPQVQSFCILVKFWAKARKVINSKSAMKGFSSYVLILMCIYYLMDTNQIGFLEGDPEKLIENPLGSARLSLKKVQVKGLYENFIGFLQYYRENGKFRGQRKVVNLLKKQLPETFAFNQNFVVNVYDFVDKSNPGRLEMKDKDPIFLEFERMLVLLRQRNIPKIAQVLAGK